MKKFRNGVAWLQKKISNFSELEGYYIYQRTRAKYYIIIRSEGGAGFFSNYMWVLGHVVLARKLGYIPVIDMKNYPTLYSEEIKVNGTYNAWNYYFQNIDDITLNEIYQSGKYVLGQDKYLTKYAEKYCMPKYRFPTEKTIHYYTPVIDKNMQLLEELKMEYEDAWKKIIGEKDCVLGIHIRGTDMKNQLGHPVPATTQTYLEQTFEMLGFHPEITGIFLATDEENVKQIYEKEFCNTQWTLFMNDVFRVWDNGERRKIGVHETRVEQPRKLHKYLMGKEVLQDAWFLSKCDYLICGHSNVSNVVLMWNRNQYKQVVCVENDRDGEITEI